MYYFPLTTTHAVVGSTTSIIPKEIDKMERNCGLLVPVAMERLHKPTLDRTRVLDTELYHFDVPVPYLNLVK